VAVHFLSVVRAFNIFKVHSGILLVNTSATNGRTSTLVTLITPMQESEAVAGINKGDSGNGKTSGIWSHSKSKSP